MKVLQIVQAYWPAKGGSQFLAQKVAEGLVRGYGDEVTVFTTVAPNSAYFTHGGDALPVGIQQLNGVTVERFPIVFKGSTLREGIASLTYRLRLPGNDYWRTLHQGPIIAGLTDRIATSGAEVIFANPFPLCHMFNALDGAKRSRTPLVYLGSIHTTDEWGYDRPMIYRAIRQADAYIALSEVERDYVIARGAEPHKVFTLSAGVDLEPFRQANREEMRHRLGLGSDPTLIVLATQTERKRLDLMLQAMPIIWEKVPSTRLIMAGGRSSYSLKLEALIAAMPKTQRERITVISDFPEEEKASLLAASDVLILPSIEESFGIVFLESWAAGNPVIGAGVGAVSTLIDEGVDGLHFSYPHAQSLAEACVTLLDNPSRARAMGQAGLAKVRARYTWDHVVAQIRAVIHEIIRNN